MIVPRRTLLVFALCLILLATWTYQAEAAAPWFLIFHGKPLQKQMVLSDWYQNQKLMLSITEVASISDRDLQERPYIEMAYFWGPEWARYLVDEGAIDKLQPQDGNQHGRFYPAYGNAEAVVTFDQIPGSGPSKRRIKEEGLSILAKYGIPTRVEKGR